MTLEVLVSTMYQKDYSLLDRMNIQTDAIVVNQCNENSIEEFEYKGHKIKWISLNEQGVGLSRNTALMRSTADICLFADDDVVYEDGYEQLVVDAFKEKSKADLIIFNLESQNPSRPEFITKKTRRLHWYNCLRYGAFRIAIRRKQIVKANIVYSLLFGGGAEYQAGEDNLFITQCLQAKLKGYSFKTHIGTVEQKESTWFRGYTQKYYYGRGALFRAMYSKKAKIILFIFELTRGKDKKEPLSKRLKWGFKGIKEFSYRSNDVK